MINQNFENQNFFQSNFSHQTSFIYIDKVILSNDVIDHNTKTSYKSLVGSGFVIAGQPILKKRFVMAGSSVGTSVASKYLSHILPQKLPFRILGTTVLGRAIGRIVPYEGWTLLGIEIVEIIIEYSEYKDKNEFSFGGGSFGGGGAGGVY